MRNKFLFIILFVLAATFYFASPAKAAVYGATQDFYVNLSDDSGGHELTWPLGVPAGFAVQLGNFHARLDGHGDFGPAGGRGSLIGCLSFDTAVFSSGGQCTIYVDSSGNGNVGDGHADYQGFKITANPYTPFHFWVIKVYANDATWGYSDTYMAVSAIK